MKSKTFPIILAILLVLTIMHQSIIANAEVPAEDFVDVQSNVDGVADKGAHSNFAAQQATDWINDTLTEADQAPVTGNSENFVDANTSNVDGHVGHGTSSNFTAQQDANIAYNDTLTEANTAGTAGFSYKQGTFTANIVTGNQIVNTGSGVVIKALILYGSWQTAEGFSAGESGFLSYIVSTTQRKCIAWASDDNVATSNTGCGTANAAVLVFSAGTPTQDGLADFVSFGTGADAGKFTITWSDAPSIAFIIHYVALGGSDLTNVFVGEYAAKTGSTGSVSYTGVGFQGDVILFSGISKTTVGTMAGMCPWMGAAKSPTARGSIFWAARDANTIASRTKHWQDTTKCVSISVATASVTPAIDAKADFVSFGSDGFTLSWTDYAGSAWLFFVMVLKGGQYNVNTFTAPASTGAQSITTGFQPAGVLFFGAGQTTVDATLGAEAHVCLGAMGNSPIGEGSIWTSADDTATTDSNKRTVTTKSVQVCTNPSTVAAEADATSLNSNGFTITWTTTSSGRRFFSVAFGYSINYELDLEFQWTTADPNQSNEYLCIRASTFSGTAENLGVDVWTGSPAAWVLVSGALTASQWNNFSISSYLNQSTIYFRFIGKTESSDTARNTWVIECNLIHVWTVGVNYQLELEERFTDCNYSRTNEELCVRMGAMDAETLSVQWWNSTESSWLTIIASLSANIWNNFSVATYLTSVNFTIRFIDGTQSSDTSQSIWNKDSCLLHTWETIVYYSLSFRIYDYDVADTISGASVTMNNGSDQVKTSDASGWANYTGVSGTVAVEVQYYGFWVNGTFSVTLSADTTIDIQCNLYDISVKTVEAQHSAYLVGANVTVFNSTSDAPNKIATGITGSNGIVELANLPNCTLTFTQYGGSSYTLIIGSTTQPVSSENQSFTITADQNNVSTNSSYSIIAFMNF